jgi:hypothetical protein
LDEKPQPIDYNEPMNQMYKNECHKEEIFDKFWKFYEEPSLKTNSYTQVSFMKNQSI